MAELPRENSKKYLFTYFLSVKTLTIDKSTCREEEFEFCWNSLADEHNTVAKSTIRLVKWDKFIFGTP